LEKPGNPSVRACSKCCLDVTAGGKPLQPTKKQSTSFPPLSHTHTILRVQQAPIPLASAGDGQGEGIYPRKASNEFIDRPGAEKGKQNMPSFSAEVMTGLARWKKPRECMVFMLCGAGVV
jgi:hypothetical protein